jgi:hypothetical protein
MRFTSPLQSQRLRRDGPAGSAQGTLFWTIGAGVPLAACVIASILPPPVALPAFAIALMLSGFALAAVGCLMRPSAAVVKTMTRDLAGMLVLIGCAAAMMTDEKLALQSFDALLASDYGSILQAVGAGRDGG